MLAQQDPKFVQGIELAIRFGRVVIATEVDSIEPVLMNLLRKDFQVQGARKSVQIGDKVLDVSDMSPQPQWPSRMQESGVRLHGGM